MKITNYSHTFRVTALASVLALILFTGCVTTQDNRSKLGAVPEFHPELGLGALQGYLGPEALPNSLALIPPPLPLAQPHLRTTRRLHVTHSHCEIHRASN